MELRAREAERAAADERARIAQEIHDGLVQELWLARLTNGELKQMPRLSADARDLSGKVDGMLEDALAEARYAVASLQPAPPTKTIGADLQRLTDDYANHFNMEIELAVDDDPPVADDVRGQLRAICREALNNVRKHADASYVRVRLKANGGRLRMMVSDNGSGFDVEANPSGFGLSGMRQRAAKVGGRVARRLGAAGWDAHHRRHADAGSGSRQATGRESSPVSVSQAEPLRVMLVEDHVLVRSAIRSMLNNKGIEVVSDVATAEEALACVTDCRPDVVLVDIDLPGMSGVDLVKELAPRMPGRQDRDAHRVQPARRPGPGDAQWRGWLPDQGHLA